MLYVLASIVFLYHQWLQRDFEKLEKTVRQGGVSCLYCGVYSIVIKVEYVCLELFLEKNMPSKIDL